MTERKNLTFILAALSVVLATIFIGVLCGTPLQASAATTPRYTVAFSYTCTYQYNTTHRTDSSGTDTTSATVKDSHVVTTDTWVSMGQEAEKDQRMQDFKDYRVDSKVMSLAHKKAIFLHL